MDTQMEVINSWKPERCRGINTRCYEVDSYRPIQYKARFRDNRQATDIFHGYR
jgi:hypothetical protein